MLNNPPETYPRFQQKQAEFTAFIRNPEHNPAPSDIPHARIAVYAELMFNNIESFLSTNFPVIRTLLPDDAWLKLVRDFYAQHHSSSPYFAEIPEEFINYLENERQDPEDFPFLLELAHYEWVEMALSIAQEDPQFLDTQSVEHITQVQLALSPLAWPLAYQYPVHQIAPTFIPNEKTGEYTLICVYRAANDDVKFLHLAPVTYRLMEMLQTTPGLTGLSYLQQLAEETQHPNPAWLIQTGTQTFQDLAQKGIIIQAEPN